MSHDLRYNICVSYLSEVEVDETEGEELQTDREAVKEPIKHCGQVIGFQGIMEVEREQSGTKSRPEKTEEQKPTLVAPALVSVEKEEPELNVDYQEETSVESSVEDGKSKLD